MNHEDPLSGAEDVSSAERASRSRKSPEAPGRAGAQFLSSATRLSKKAVSGAAHRKELRKLFQGMQRSAATLGRQHDRWVASDIAVTELCRQELDRLFLSLAVDRIKSPRRMVAELTRAALLVQLQDIASSYPEKPKKSPGPRERKSVGEHNFRDNLSPLPHQAELQVAAAVKADREFRARIEALQRDGSL